MKRLNIEFTISKDGGWTRVYHLRQDVLLSESEGQWQATDSEERWHGQGESEYDAVADWLHKRIRENGTDTQP